MPRYSTSMDFIVRVGWLGGVVLVGTCAVGCGEVSEASGGAGTGGAGNARPELGDAGSKGLPASTDPFAFAKSGDRVLALGYVSEDVVQFRVRHDQQRDFDCEFASGTGCSDFRCFPKQSATPIFLDANCSEPATWMDP